MDHATTDTATTGRTGATRARRASFILVPSLVLGILGAPGAARAESNPAPIPVVHTLEVKDPGRTAQETFQCLAGQRYAFRIEKGTTPGLVKVWLNKGVARQLLKPMTTWGEWRPLESGTCTLEWDPNGQYKGKAVVTRHDTPADTELSIAPNGGAVELVTDSPGQNALATFECVKGTRYTAKFELAADASRKVKFWFVPPTSGPRPIPIYGMTGYYGATVNGRCGILLDPQEEAAGKVRVALMAVVPVVVKPRPKVPAFIDDIFVFDRTSPVELERRAVAVPLVGSAEPVFVASPGLMENGASLSGTGGEAYSVGMWPSDVLKAPSDRSANTRISATLNIHQAQWSYEADFVGTGVVHMCVGLQLIDADTNEVVAEPGMLTPVMVEGKTVLAPCVANMQRTVVRTPLSPATSVERCWKGTGPACTFGGWLSLTVKRPVVAGHTYYWKAYAYSKVKLAATAGNFRAINHLERVWLAVKW